MTDKNIEQLLKEEISSETPDILESLMKECAFSEASVSEDQNGKPAEETQILDLKNARRNRKAFIAFGSIAAAVVLLITGISMYNLGLHRGSAPEPETLTASVPAAIVTLDVNPSLELNVDSEGCVVSWNAVNEDARTILEDIDLKGADIKVAVYAFVGSMITKGYLNENVNSILLSVISADSETGRRLEKDLVKDINAYLENSLVHAAVFGQYAGKDEEVENFAKKNGLSFGKAWLIRRLLADDSKQTEESLLKLTTQELLLLWELKPTVSETEERTIYGSVSLNRYISKEEAAAAAFNATGTDAGNAQILSVEFDCEDGRIVYEVEFVCNGVTYEAEVDAASGEVLEYESDGVPKASPASVQKEDRPEADEEDEDDQSEEIEDEDDDNDDWFEDTEDDRFEEAEEDRDDRIEEAQDDADDKDEDNDDDDIDEDDDDDDGDDDDDDDD